MADAPTFQDMILRLHRYWADWGCLIWQPYNVQVGAGTMNPATVLRVLGPEPWNVGYVEPSVRPDDSRYFENPNRVQQHIQYQVILKPDPGNPQDLYLGSLEAIGIDRSRHDIRFVEDNWESPALGAWGLGWEVWLDGLEITQFTYFQQAGGFTLDPVAVELTYGLERIAMFLQRVDHFKEIRYAPSITYGEMFGGAEYEHSRYNLDDANIEAQNAMFRLYESEAQRCIELGLILPAHDFVLKCSHAFNVLDARGAIGVTERAKYFARMRDLARQISQAFLEQRQRLEFPLLDDTAVVSTQTVAAQRPMTFDNRPRSFVLEIGTEELPPGDVAAAIIQLEEAVPCLLSDVRLHHRHFRILGSPRRLTIWIDELSPRQRDTEEVVKGPPAHVAFGQDGQPTRAALGFARSRGLDVNELQIREIDGGRYAVGVVRRTGRAAGPVLAEALAELIAGISFGKSMRWNDSGVAFSRPIRWLLALLGDAVISFAYAGITSDRYTRGLRPDGSPRIRVESAESYLNILSQANVLLDGKARRASIAEQIERLAADVDGVVPSDSGLLDEVTDLVEQPTAFLGRFDEKYLALPRELLIMVMRKHQRYFPVTQARSERLLPVFIGVRNGSETHMDIVRHGNEQVIRARFADAEFFWKADTEKRLEDYVPRLNTLTFQEQLGSMRDKTLRLENTVPDICDRLGMSDTEKGIAVRAAHLCKADLVTRMVTDFTALQGVMGRAYARLSGESEDVAQAIFEHYLPRHAGDTGPVSRAGLALGLANRLDSLIGLFAVGLAPTGSADPYHLRRDAMGLVHNLIAHRRTFSIRDGLALAAASMPVTVTNTTLADAAAFVRERLRGILREEGFPFDVVDAVLSDAQGDDPYRARMAVEQLSSWTVHADWAELLASYSRCVRILRPLTDAPAADMLDPNMLVEPAERTLHAAYLEAASHVDSRSSVDELLSGLIPLIIPITEFFDEVLVMAEDELLRSNRLALLQNIADLARGIVDLSKLQGF